MAIEWTMKQQVSSVTSFTASAIRPVSSSRWKRRYVPSTIFIRQHPAHPPPTVQVCLQSIASLSQTNCVYVCVCVFGLCVSHRNCGRNKRVTSSVLTAWTNSTANQKNKRVLRHDVSWWQVKARLSSPPSIRHGTTAGPHKSQGFTNRTDFFFSGHPNRRCFVCVCVCFSPFVHAVSVVGGL